MPDEDNGPADMGYGDKSSGYDSESFKNYLQKMIEERGVIPTRDISEYLSKRFPPMSDRGPATANYGPPIKEARPRNYPERNPPDQTPDGSPEKYNTDSGPAPRWNYRAPKATSGVQSSGRYQDPARLGGRTYPGVLKPGAGNMYFKSDPQDDDDDDDNDDDKDGQPSEEFEDQTSSPQEESADSRVGDTRRGTGYEREEQEAAARLPRPNKPATSGEVPKGVALRYPAQWGQLRRVMQTGENIPYGPRRVPAPAENQYRWQLQQSAGRQPGRKPTTESDQKLYPRGGDGTRQLLPQRVQSPPLKGPVYDGDGRYDRDPRIGGDTFRVRRRAPIKSPVSDDLWTEVGPSEFSTLRGVLDQSSSSKPGGLRKRRGVANRETPASVTVSDTSGRDSHNTAIGAITDQLDFSGKAQLNRTHGSSDSGASRDIHDQDVRHHPSAIINVIKDIRLAKMGNASISDITASSNMKNSSVWMRKTSAFESINFLKKQSNWYHLAVDMLRTVLGDGHRGTAIKTVRYLDDGSLPEFSEKLLRFVDCLESLGSNCLSAGDILLSRSNVSSRHAKSASLYSNVLIYATSKGVCKSAKSLLNGPLLILGQNVSVTSADGLFAADRGHLFANLSNGIGTVPNREVYFQVRFEDKPRNVMAVIVKGGMAPDGKEGVVTDVLIRITDGNHDVKVFEASNTKVIKKMIATAKHAGHSSRETMFVLLEPVRAWRIDIYPQVWIGAPVARFDVIGC